MAAFFSDTNSTEQLGKINILCTIYIKLRLLYDWINTTQSFLKLIDQLLQNKLIWYIKVMELSSRKNIINISAERKPVFLLEYWNSQP